MGYAGPGGYDQVVFRGDVGKREFIAFWMSAGAVSCRRHERQHLDGGRMTRRSDSPGTI